MTDLTSATETALASHIADLEAHGYFRIEEHDGVRAGARCRNRSEQYPEAYDNGTATVLALMQRTGSWSQTYGRPDIEVIVERTRGGETTVTAWQDYRTALVTPAASDTAEDPS